MATDTGHVAHKKTHKLFYREILLEKATDTGHVAQINFCRVVLVPRYRRLTFVESYSYLAIDDQKEGVASRPLLFGLTPLCDSPLVGQSPFVGPLPLVG